MGDAKTGVCIIIPAFNGGHMLDRCLRTFIRSRPSRARNITVVVSDDCSPKDPWEPDSRKWLDQEVAKVVSRRTEKNLGFTGNVNDAVGDAASPDDHLMLLNQDTSFDRTVAGWLDRLADTLEARHETDHAAAVGPLTNFGLTGQTTWEDPATGKPTVLGGSHSAVERSVWVPVLSGFAIIWHRSFVAQRLVGYGDLLEPDLSFSGFDDLDISLWARGQGWTLWADKSVFIWHEPPAGDEPRWHQAKEHIGRDWMVRKWGKEWESKICGRATFALERHISVEQKKAQGRVP